MTTLGWREMHVWLWSSETEKVLTDSGSGEQLFFLEECQSSTQARQLWKLLPPPCVGFKQTFQTPCLNFAWHFDSLQYLFVETGLLICPELCVTFENYSPSQQKDIFQSPGSPMIRLADSKTFYPHCSGLKAFYVHMKQWPMQSLFFSSLWATQTLHYCGAFGIPSSHAVQFPFTVMGLILNSRKSDYGQVGFLLKTSQADIVSAI